MWVEKVTGVSQGFLRYGSLTASNPGLTDLDDLVSRTLAYFEGPGRTNEARVDRWQARDVLMHFIYFHEATAWGIQSVGVGGPVFTVPADWDTINEICRILHEGETLDELMVQIRQAHACLHRAVANSPDLDRPCVRRPDGRLMTGQERLEAITDHWGEHLDELEPAPSRSD
jgi:hypothetical protein